MELQSNSWLIWIPVIASELRLLSDVCLMLLNCKQSCFRNLWTSSWRTCTQLTHTLCVVLFQTRRRRQVIIASRSRGGVCRRHQPFGVLWLPNPYFLIVSNTILHACRSTADPRLTSKVHVFVEFKRVVVVTVPLLTDNIRVNVANNVTIKEHPYLTCETFKFVYICIY